MMKFAQRESGTCAVVHILASSTLYSAHFCTEKGSGTKERMREEEIEKGNCGAANPKSLFSEIVSDLNQAVPNHLADESQTR